MPGGGTALLKAVKDIEINPKNSDQLRGAQCLLDSCLAPITQILKNANISTDIVVNSLTYDDHEINVGFNVRTESFEDMLDLGVIDPAKNCEVCVTKRCQRSRNAAHN